MENGVEAGRGYIEAYHTSQNRNLFCKYSLKGTPTVIFLSGLGDSCEAWNVVQDRISHLTSTFSYDRASIGRSETTLFPRTCRDLVEELSELLLKVPLEPPYILVGHSFGGLVARLFSSLFSNLVIGIVLVDAAPEYKELAYEKILPPHLLATNRAYLEDPMLNIEKIDKLRSYKEIVDHVQQSNIPLTILTRGLPECDNEEWPNQEILHIEQRLQAEFQRLSTQSKLKIAKNSRHDIHHDESEIVIEEIQLILQMHQQN